MHKLFAKKVIRRVIFAALGTAFLASISLAVLVRQIPVAKTDVAITRELQENHAGWFAFLMRAISFIADPPMATGSVILAALVLIGAQYQREALFMLLVPFADLASVVVKNIVARPRPTDVIVAIYEQSAGSSFPSSHVIHVVIFFGYIFVLMFVIKKIPTVLRMALSIFSILMILLISISRIYLGAHWASDVIGGYLLGFFMLGILVMAYLRVTHPGDL